MTDADTLEQHAYLALSILDHRLGALDRNKPEGVRAGYLRRAISDARLALAGYEIETIAGVS